MNHLNIAFLFKFSHLIKKAEVTDEEKNGFPDNRQKKSKKGINKFEVEKI